MPHAAYRLLGFLCLLRLLFLSKGILKERLLFQPVQNALHFLLFRHIRLAVPVSVSLVSFHIL